MEAFKRFEINVKDKICIDAGISTGGFTDCLLQHGAELVYGIDVGYGQTDRKSTRLKSQPDLVCRLLLEKKKKIERIDHAKNKAQQKL